MKSIQIFRKPLHTIVKINLRELQTNLFCFGKLWVIKLSDNISKFIGDKIQCKEY